MTICYSRLRNIIKSKHFLSSFKVIFTIATAIFLIASYLLAVQSFSQYRESAEINANRLAVAIQDELNTARNNAVFIGSMKSVGYLLAVEHPTNEALESMVTDVSPFSNQQRYESVNLFFSKSHKIYVSGVGMYTWEDYFDQDFLGELEKSPRREWWKVDKSYSRYYGEQYPVQVATYVRRLPLFNSMQEGYVAINIPLSYLVKIAEKNQAPSLMEAAVFFNDKMIYCSNGGFGKGYDSNLLPEENVKRYLADHSRLQFGSTSGTDVSCRYFISVQDMLSQWVHYLPYWGLSYLLLLAAVFLCAILYSRIMLISVDKVMKKCGGALYLERDFGQQKNEFDLLGSAFDNLNEQIVNIQHTMQENKPLIQEHLIHRIICDQMDFKNHLEEYQKYDICFPFPYFSIVVIALPNFSRICNETIKEQLKIVVRKTAEETFSTVGKTYSAYAEDDRILLILNADFYDSLQQKIHEVCRVLYENMNRTLSLDLLFSVSICSKTDPILHRAYMQAKKNMVFTYTDQEEFVFFDVQNEETSAVDSRILNQMTQCVLNKEPVQLKKLIVIFSNIYITPETTLPQAQKLSTICMCSVFTQLLDIDINLNDNQIACYIKKISEVSSVQDCSNILFAYLNSIINSSSKIPEESYAYVQKAISYIENNYMQNISIPQIADKVSINPVYLNKLFKLSTGKTISEYLNFYRIELSKKMLLDNSQSINTISQAVGYNEIRSYTRFFKKFYKITPSEYRKENSTEEM